LGTYDRQRENHQPLTVELAVLAVLSPPAPPSQRAKGV